MQNWWIRELALERRKVDALYYLILTQNTFPENCKALRRQTCCSRHFNRPQVTVLSVNVRPAVSLTNILATAIVAPINRSMCGRAGRMNSFLVFPPFSSSCKAHLWHASFLHVESEIEALASLTINRAVAGLLKA